MFHTALIVAALVAPAQKQCHCSPDCTCGCNQGKPCACNGKPAQPERPKESKRTVEEGKGDAFPVDPDGTWNFGLDRQRIDGKTKYKFGDQEISYQEAMRLIEEGIPDDANKLRVTVIGPEAERKRVVADLDSQAFAPLKNLFIVQAYEPTNPMIQGLGFVTTGNPTIYVQKPDGTVMHRQDSYDGPSKLATAIRRADPNYNPANDPDLAQPPKPVGPGGGFDLSRVPMWLWVVLGGSLLVLASNNKEEAQK